jgi:hypothetical protein
MRNVTQVQDDGLIGRLGKTVIAYAHRSIDPHRIKETAGTIGSLQTEFDETPPVADQHIGVDERRAHRTALRCDLICGQVGTDMRQR